MLPSKLQETESENSIQLLYRLERVQERGLRAAFKDKLSSYKQLLEKATLPTLNNRRLQDMWILMCKVKQSVRRTICSMFYTNSHTYSLRQRDFHLPRFNTVTYGISRPKTMEQTKK